MTSTGQTLPGTDGAVPPDEAYGSVGRVGYIAPAAVTDVFTKDFYRIAPPEALLVVTILGLQGISERDAEKIDAALQNVEHCAQILTDFNAQAIGIGGFPPGVARGIEGMNDLVRRIEETSGLPGQTSPGAAVEALRAAGASRVAIASPLADIHNRKLAELLEFYDFEVTTVHSMDIRHEQIPLLSRSASYHAGAEALQAGGRPDTVFFPCGQWPTLDSLAPLEERFGVTAISSIAAQAWNYLGMVGVKVERPEFGRLLAGQFAS